MNSRATHHTPTWLLPILTVTMALTSATPSQAQVVSQVQAQTQTQRPTQPPTRVVPTEEMRTPGQVFAEMNEDWPHHFRNVRRNIDDNKNYIALIVIEPSLPMDLRSAELFRRSYLAPGYSDSFQKPRLGHNMIAWQCVHADGRATVGATGFSGESAGQSNSLAKGGWGLAAVVSTYTDGNLQSSRSVGNTIDWRSKDERTWGVVFEVEREQCESMLAFIQEFVFHPNEPMRKFGLAVRPERFEGGGCGSWAAVLLAKARIFPDAVQSAFEREVFAPTSLFGAGLPIPPTTQPFVPQNLAPSARQSVSLLRFLDGPWQGPGPQERMHVTDPEMVLFAVRKLHEFHLEDLRAMELRGEVAAGTYRQTEDWHRAQYPKDRVILSRTPWSDPDVIPNLPGQDNGAPFFVRRFSINDDFDSHTRAISNGLRWWWNERGRIGRESVLIPSGRVNYLLIRKPVRAWPLAQLGR